jgi:hypothetical protein
LRPIVISSILVLVAVTVFAKHSIAVENRTAGGRSAGLANASVALIGAEALFQNQAALGFEKNLSAIVAYESRFLLKEYAHMSLGIVIPSDIGSFGAGFWQFGSGVYRENKVGVAYARNFGENISGALQFNYFSETIPEKRDPNTSFTAEVGVMFRITEKVTGGIHVFNPLMTKLNTPGGKQQLPWIIRVGEVWYLSKQILWSVEVEKHQNHPWIIKTGLEYQPHPSLFFRAGVIGASFQPTGGAGFHFGKFIFDIGFSYHGNLGFAPATSLCFVL